MGGDLDSWIASVRKCELISEGDLKHLCEYVQEIMLEESTVQPVSSPVTICGDIHGQVWCLAPTVCHDAETRLRPDLTRLPLSYSTLRSSMTSWSSSVMEANARTPATFLW